MTQWMIDEAWAFADPAATRAAGIDVVSGYLSFDPSKNWTRARIDAYHSVGISCLLNWEATPGAPLQGAGVGVNHANAASDQAAGLGAPAGTVLVYSCDTDATVDQVRAYYVAAANITHQRNHLIGAYGGAAVVIPLLQERVVDVGWVANANSWDHGIADLGAHLHQLYGHPIHIAGSADSSFDLNVILQPIPGLWTPTGVSQGADLTPEEHQLLVEAHEMLGHVKDGTYVLRPANGINTGSDIVARIEDAIKAIPQIAANVTVDVNAIATAVAHALGAKLST